MPTSHGPDAAAVAVAATDDLTPAAPDLVADMVATLGTLLDLRTRVAGSMKSALTAERADQVEALEGQRQAIRIELSRVMQGLPAIVDALDARGSALLRLLAARASAADAEVDLLLAQGQHDGVGSWLRARGVLDLEAVATLLAEPWNPEADLIVLVGQGAAAASAVLTARGQKRVFSLDPAAPATTTSTDAPTPALANFHTLAALDTGVARLPWPLPPTVRTEALGPGPASAAEVLSTLQRTLGTLARANADIERSVAHFAAAAVNNLGEIARRPSIACLRGAFAGMPAVVVAAGPSLDRNIAQLSALRGRAVIIGINQTARALARAGLQADFTLCIESRNVGYHFEGVPPETLGTLVLGASVPAQLFSQPAARTLTFAAEPLAEGWIYKAMNEEAAVDSGATVATTAISFAAFLGASPIISVGRDLALEGRRYYADGAADGGQLPAIDEATGTISLASMTSKRRMAEGPSGDKQAIEQMLAGQVFQLVEVPGFHGRPVVSTDLFQLEMGLLREVMRSYPPGTRFINATEGGAFLEGMEHRSLSEVIAALPEGDLEVKSRVAGLLASTAGDAEQRQRRLALGLAAMVRDMRLTVALAGQSAALCGAQSREENAQYEATVARLRVASQSHRIISALVQRTTRAIMGKRQGTWSSLDELVAAERRLYEAIERAVGRLTEQIAAALGRL